MAGWSAPKLSCAGTIRVTALCHPPFSCRCSKKAGGSCRWAAGSFATLCARCRSGRCSMAARWLATLNEINEGGFPLDRLKMELTESAFMRNPEMARGVLHELRDLGIQIALDDFGTGYSALGALRQYAVDTIKIDCDFTARLDTTEGKELVLAL